MELRLPALNLTAKLLALMVALLALTIGAAILVSVQTQDAVVAESQAGVKDLAHAIQISVQELTAVGNTDRDRLQNYVKSLGNRGLEVSIASNQNLIINSSNPKLIGTALSPESRAVVVGPAHDGNVPAFKLGPSGQETTVYQIPVEVEDHLMGYVLVKAQFGAFAQLITENRQRLIMLGTMIFAFGIVFAWVLAQRYVAPIHAVAAAAQNIAARGLEPVPEARRRDEIGLLTRSFNEMVMQLRRAREREQEFNRLERFTALGQLAGGLAHEIKNPLNFISLAADQLRARYASQIPTDRDREQYLRQLGMMKDEIRRLSELVQSFMNYGKPIEIRPAPIDLHRLVQDVLELSESKLRSQSIEVVEQDIAQAATLNLDAEKIRACFINVVANATQAMPDGGRLMIRFTRNAGRQIVSFEDTGAGIEPEVAAKVFEPFFTTKREGIGLGLFLSRAIVEKHGGTITIEPSAPPPGTNVTFTFPLRQDASSHETSLGAGG